MRPFTLNAIALAALSLLGTAAQAQSSASQELETVNVTGNGDKLGTGLLIDEDAPKARSSVTKAQLEKMRSSSNPFQALSLLPGVNSSSFDATGMFGGNLRVRGYNSDQMGFTINGAPVNDSGSFSVFPQEYVDAENLCTLYITQGAPDTDSPHVGASGGNVGIVSCAPTDEQVTRVSFSGGQLGYYRLFGRVNTGKIGNFKGYVSVSDSKVDKWRGYGRASRKHLDAAAEYDLGNTNKLSATLLYNRAITNNYAAWNQAQWNAQGYYSDFSTVIPQHQTPVAGTKQTDVNSTPAYYGYSLNPFENYLLTGKGTFALGDKLRLDVNPYFWYGYGTGGTQQNTLTESTSGVHGGIGDINGDGDRQDTVLVYRGSLTQTYRPGVTTTLTYTLDNQRISGGFWFERARHRQTQPAVRVDNNGGITDIWLGGNLINYNDGTPYQGRSWMTISTGESVFIQDTIDLLNNKLQVTPAFSYRRLKREFTNFANSGSIFDYEVNKTYSEPLPSIAVSYQATPSTQVFGSVAKNFKAPGNFEYQNLAQVTNGVFTGLAPVTVNQETSINVDL
ncbi:MAG TPA: TonB-dependent receptor, partial [Burkholderiaceae bacterium]